MKSELDRLRDKFDENYAAWNPNLPYKERERLTRENQEIFSKIMELNQQVNHGPADDLEYLRRFRR